MPPRDKQAYGQTGNPRFYGGVDVVRYGGKVSKDSRFLYPFNPESVGYTLESIFKESPQWQGVANLPGVSKDTRAYFEILPDYVGGQRADGLINRVEIATEHWMGSDVCPLDMSVQEQILKAMTEFVGTIAAHMTGSKFARRVPSETGLLSSQSAVEVACTQIELVKAADVVAEKNRKAGAGNAATKVAELQQQQQHGSVAQR